jgi:hypothetical protein
MVKHIIPLSLVSLLATCQPSYAEVGLSRFGINSVFVEELNTGLSLIKSDVRKSHFIAPHYQQLNNHSFNYVDVVAVNGNNDRQEPKNLFKPVSHRTIADVFLCLSFIFLPFMGELRLAIALLALWWGGSGNKPFIRRIPLAVGLTVLSLPAALFLGKTSLPLRKV